MAIRHTTKKGAAHLTLAEVWSVVVAIDAACRADMSFMEGIMEGLGGMHKGVCVRFTTSNLILLDSSNALSTLHTLTTVHY